MSATSFSSEVNTSPYNPAYLNETGWAKVEPSNVPEKLKHLFNPPAPSAPAFVPAAPSVEQAIPIIYPDAIPVYETVNVTQRAPLYQGVPIDCYIAPSPYHYFATQDDKYLYNPQTGNYYRNAAPISGENTLRFYNIEPKANLLKAADWATWHNLSTQDSWDQVFVKSVQNFTIPMASVVGTAGAVLGAIGGVFLLAAIITDDINKNKPIIIFNLFDAFKGAALLGFYAGYGAGFVAGGAFGVFAGTLYTPCYLSYNALLSF